MDRGAWWATLHGVTRSGCNLATKPPLKSAVGQYPYFKLDLWKYDFIELLAAQHEMLTNEDLVEFEAQRKDEERQEEEEVTEEVANGKRIFFIWVDTVSFWPKCRIV